MTYAEKQLKHAIMLANSKGLSISKACELAGFHRSAFSQWQTKGRNVGVATLGKLIDFLEAYVPETQQDETLTDKLRRLLVHEPSPINQAMCEMLIALNGDVRALNQRIDLLKYQSTKYDAE